MSIHDMLATASAVVSGAAAETSGQGAASKGKHERQMPNTQITRHERDADGPTPPQQI